ncbi:unnamed protein product [Psylliodes chrysocephalus]|uniref:Pickpocket protein 28-like n=1 Tax=Psylliodes chrysocephalus TaxID=3402493 RepID=A0A9P0CIW4_9CUCU|nr:unnamed protein product [Psylliodes chrysocephala]
MESNKETGSQENDVKLRITAKNDGNGSRKSKSTLKRTHDYFKEYCNSTSIHGLKYLAESRSLGERLLWLTLILCSLSACAYLILQIYGKFQQSPVIVSFATTESPIYTIPFPAVTICPLTKASKDIFDFTDIILKMRRNISITEEERRYAKYMSLVCEVDNELFSEEVTFTEDIFEALDEMKIPVEETMTHCKFLNMKAASCSDMFYPIILDQSICYTFNLLDRKYIYNENVVHFKNYHYSNESTVGWTLDKGYEKTEDDRLNNPFRAFISGADNALEVTFYQNISNNDPLCIQDVQGFSVLLHAPYAVPLLKKQYFNVGFDRVVMASVRPRAMSTSDKVLQFSSSIRQCYFSTEKKLKYFNIYSPRNCKLECLTNFTLKTCGCVSYYMPRVSGTPICGNANYMCMERAELRLKMKQLEEQIIDYEESFYCDCKPLCTDITYDSEVSSSPWDFKPQWNVGENRSFPDEEHYSKLLVYFEHDSFLTSERNELYGPTDFLANFGGLLGLFTGFSLLSAAEIIYFLTVRMCCNFRLFGAWTGRQE